MALHRLKAQVILSDSSSADALGDNWLQARDLPVLLAPSADPDTALYEAQLVVTSPGIPRTAPVLQRAVEKGLPIISEVELAYRIAPCPIIAVTGTNGKSTTAVWIAGMLRASGFTTHIAGNISADALKMTLTEAAEQSDEGDVIVAEISSFQLEWVERFRPRVGVLTNVRLDHLDRHGSMNEYAACKARLFAAQRHDDVAILNAVNAPSRLIARGIRSRVVWFDAAHCLCDACACVDDGELVVRWQGTEHRLVRTQEVSLKGRHNLENALAASAAAIAFGADPEAVRRLLRTFDGLPHRMETVDTINGVEYINASMTTNVDAAVRVLESIDRPVVLIAGGRPKRESYDPLGHAIARHVTFAVLLGEAADMIAEAAAKAGFANLQHASTMDAAVTLAAENARPGDVVVLCPGCSSKDMYSDFEERGRAFRDAVRRLRDAGERGYGG